MVDLFVRVPSVVLAAALLVPAPSMAKPQQPAQPQQPAPQQAAKPVTQAPTPPTSQPPRPRPPMTSVDVEVVILRYQGQKQISRVPYLLAVTANSPVQDSTQLNMGTDVPITSTTFIPAASGDKPADAQAAPKPLQSYSYRSVGTSISCRAVGGEDGRYEVTISVDDSSVFSSPQPSTPMPVVGGVPAFRSFKTRNLLLLSDGQTRKFTAASDRLSGETMEVEVTLRVVK